MSLHATNTLARERILSFGGAGLGKSYDFYAIARLSKKTRSDAIFYVVDTDVSVGRMLGDEAFAEALLGPDGQPVNVVAEDTYDWQSLNDALDRFTKVMRPQDWLMIDMLSPTWDWCQAEFTDKVFHKDLDAYFLEARSQMKGTDKKGGSFEGWKDWPVINQMYKSFQTKLLRCPGNLYATAEVKAINSDTAEKDTRLMFGPHGVIPVGQKRNPHIFQTVLWKTATRPNEWEVITVKDRSRRKMEGEPVRDFAKDYLLKVAGWSLASEKVAA